MTDREREIAVEHDLDMCDEAQLTAARRIAELEEERDDALDGLCRKAQECNRALRQRDETRDRIADLERDLTTLHKHIDIKQRIIEGLERRLEEKKDLANEDGE